MLQSPAAIVEPVKSDAQALKHTSSSLPWIALTIGGQAADTITTCIARRNPNIIEGNGVMARHSCSGMAKIKGSVAVANSVYLYFLNKNHPKAAKWLGIFNGAVGFGLSVMALINMGTAKR